MISFVIKFTKLTSSIPSQALNNKFNIFMIFFYYLKNISNIKFNIYATLFSLKISKMIIPKDQISLLEAFFNLKSYEKAYICSKGAYLIVYPWIVILLLKFSIKDVEIPKSAITHFYKEELTNKFFSFKSKWAVWNSWSFWSPFPIHFIKYNF